MKTMFNVWILLGVLVSVAVSQSSYHPEYLQQNRHDDSEEAPYHLSSRSHHSPSSYVSPEEGNDPRHYQSLESRYHEPETYERAAPQYRAAPQSVQYHTNPQHVQYPQPEDPSYHRPQEIAYHSSPEHYQEVAPDYKQPSRHVEPEDKEDGSYASAEPRHVPEPKYAREPKYAPEHQRSPSSHPAPVPTDPKLPLYFTMYEKRVVQDPTDKYGKGPWRYLTYGHGITYGSKEPGKVFEKGYGYIRALGRDHCKLPEHLCPPRDEKPFDYEGRKEPYFGYRPH